MKLLSILIISFFISGCALIPDKPSAIITEKRVQIDPRIYEGCKPLILLSKKDWDHVQEVGILNDEIYLDCKLKNAAKSAVIKEFSNVTKPKP